MSGTRPGDGGILGFADDPEEPRPDDASDVTSDDRQEEPERRRRRGFLRRHRALTVLLVLLALVLASVGLFAGYVNHEIGRIPKVTLKVPEADRPAAPTNGSMNILLAGADNGSKGGSIAEMVARGDWKPGAHRSDTIMILHLTSDRKHAYLVSVPRDTYVDVDGYGGEKINAAFSFGGPSLYVRTLEQFSGLRMQHLAIIDWDGFRDLADALGGVRVYVSETTADYHQGEWTQGWTTLRGDRALRYVRTRYGLRNGDYDRIQRQQNFLRAALNQTVSKGTMTNPARFNQVLQSIVGNLTVDSDFDSGEIRSLAWSLRHLRAKDITFITTPMARFASNDAGSVIIPDRARTKELFGDVASDDLGSYVKKYGGSGTLGGTTDIR